jgi:hypothetical protein
MVLAPALSDFSSASLSIRVRCEQPLKYITRQLYQAMQTLDQSGDLDRRWKFACESYRKELERDRNLLPPSMQKFSDMTFHDGVIKSAELATNGDLQLQIDASRNPWGPRGIFELRFAGVVTIEGLDAIIGDEWLYEEVYAHPAGFDYRVLLFRSELRVVAASVDLSPAGQGPSR